MADGKEEREEQKKIKEQEKQRSRQDGYEPPSEDWTPERRDS